MATTDKNTLNSQEREAFLVLQLLAEMDNTVHLGSVFERLGSKEYINFLKETYNDSLGESPQTRKDIEQLIIKVMKRYEKMGFEGRLFTAKTYDDLLEKMNNRGLGSAVKDTKGVETRYEIMDAEVKRDQELIKNHLDKFSATFKTTSKEDADFETYFKTEVERIFKEVGNKYLKAKECEIRTPEEKA